MVFPCGWIAHGDDVPIYYGAAVTFVAMATANIEELIDVAFSHPAA